MYKYINYIELKSIKYGEKMDIRVVFIIAMVVLIVVAILADHFRKKD